LLERMWAVLNDGEASPMLLTGEAGAGKTWLARRFATELPAPWRAATVDLGAAMNARDLLNLIGHSLGISLGNRLGAARLACQDALEDEAAEGRSWLLVLDEVHRASASAWDEIRAIANGQARSAGFRAILILGRTPLARTVMTTGFGGLAPGLLVHLHLWPLDLDEARDLLGTDQFTDEEALEELHRDARGNPAMLLRLARRRSELRRPDARSLPQRPHGYGVAEIEPASAAAMPQITTSRRTDNPTSSQAAAELSPSSRAGIGPPLIPTKAPLRIEDGLVEVGWDGDLAAESDETGQESPSSAPVVDGEWPYREAPIQDHYAALQARAEQARNEAQQFALAEEARSPLGQEMLPDADKSFQDAASGAVAAQHQKPEPALPAASIRAEGQHEFAPYSQLFNRLRHSKS
jgi:general secretion pathway protein A